MDVASPPFIPRGIELTSAQAEARVEAPEFLFHPREQEFPPDFVAGENLQEAFALPLSRTRAVQKTRFPFRGAEHI